MPKAGTVTIQIEPMAVLLGVSWLVKQRPYENPSLFLTSLSAVERQSRELEYLQKVNDVAARCHKWLKRNPAGGAVPRIQAPFEKHGLNLPRDLATWLGGYWRSRTGLFGLRKPKREAAADWFFLSCHMSTNKRMGRPTLTREQLVERTSGEVGDHYQRFMRDRRRLERMPALNALLDLTPRD